MTYRASAIGAAILALLGGAAYFGAIDRNQPEAPEHPTTLASALQQLPPSERASTKGREIAKIRSIPRTSRGQYEIEIVSMNAIEGGVEVFVRAWKNGEQIGFGKDGTVDIERFRIFNPPILVTDTNGDIVQEWTDTDGNTQSRRLREDPQEALLQVIEHNLSVMRGVHDEKRIIIGKVGNTTSTFFPSGGTGSVERITPGTNEPSTGGESWSDLRIGAGNTNSGTNEIMILRTYPLQKADTWYILSRLILQFDTTSLEDTDEILSGTLSIFNQSKFDTDNQYGAGLGVYGSTPASTASLSNSDYLQTGVIPYSDVFSYAAIATNAYNDYTLNATGLTAISKTDFTRLSIKLVADSTNSPPSHSYASGHNQNIRWYSVHRAGTAQDPKLVVEHESSSPAGEEYFQIYSYEPAVLRRDTIKV